MRSTRTFSRFTRPAYIASALMLIPVTAITTRAVMRQTQTVIIACAGNLLGNLRVVRAASDCLVTEHAVQWNVVGPAGPVGPQGPQGIPGPQGPQGPEGPAGASSASMWMIMNADGSILRSKGVVEGPFTGRFGSTYFAQFADDINDCVPNANATLIDTPSGPFTASYAMVTKPSDSQFEVVLFDADGQIVEGQVSLVVTCR